MVILRYRLKASRVRWFLWLWLGSAVVGLVPSLMAQTPSAPPTARLNPATRITLPSPVDSNSPAVWERVDGRQRLFLYTSAAGAATVNEGPDLTRLAPRGPASFESLPEHGAWFEAIIPATDGTWYGYYHTEAPAVVCDDVLRTIPRIGAARSRDFGVTWEDLGVVLASPPRSHDCASTNGYFVGGVGDFSVILDEAQQYLYFFFSQYASREAVQGVAVARMVWADRDVPGGKASVWFRNQSWLPTKMVRVNETVRYVYPAGSPIYRVTNGWHDDDIVDAFWGPSVHWNTYLRQYVMLLNRAKDAEWTQEGIYVAFAPTLSEPAAWSVPQRLITGGLWYPQVLGTDVGIGTDRIAGERARFFMAGRSEYVIQFIR